MSKLVEGVIQLKCTLEVLRRALINVMPEWAEHIKVDPNGQIPLYGYLGDDRGVRCHLLIPGAGNPNYPMPPGRHAHNDWGLTQTEDGRWKMIKAEFGLDQALALEGNIKAEVAHMKAIAVAKKNGDEIVSHTNNEEENVTIIKVKQNKRKANMMA